MIRIEEIKWLSKEDAEAEVWLSDGCYKLLCFAHPYKPEFENGGYFLHTLGADHIVRSLKEEFEVQQINETFSHYLTGKLIDIKEKIIKVGEFNIYLDNFLPGDLVEEMFLSFSCERIDLD